MDDRFEGSGVGFGDPQDLLDITMDEEDDLMFLSISQMYVIRWMAAKRISRSKKHRRWYVRNLNINRDVDGEMNRLVRPMRTYDFEWFTTYLRQCPAQWDELVQRLSPHLQHPLNHRRPISAETRITITLRYYITCQTSFELATSFRVGRCTVERIIKEVSDTIAKVLGPSELPKPSTEQLQKIAEGFAERWNFPLCIGATDGKHCAIRCPRRSGSTFFNHKQYYSVILLAVCDHQYKFIYANVGTPGSQSDSTVFSNSWFGQNLTSLCPADAPLDGKSTPHVLVGDQGFPLTQHMMRPYAQCTINSANAVDGYRMKVANYRISRARRISENCFGILTHRFRCLRGTIEYAPDVASSIIMGCVIMHNFLSKSNEVYTNRSIVDSEDDDGYVIPGSWRMSGAPLPSAIDDDSRHNSTRAAKQIRDHFSQYFIGNGRLSFQATQVQRGYHSK